jgi:hypothetical protein
MSDGVPARSNSRTDKRLFTKFVTGQLHSNWLIRYNAGQHATILTETFNEDVSPRVIQRTYISHESTHMFGCKNPPDLLHIITLYQENV